MRVVIISSRTRYKLQHMRVCVCVAGGVCPIRKTCARYIGMVE